MQTDLKPNRKYDDVFAILRSDSDYPEEKPLEARITATKVVADAERPEAEVKRLNELNGGKAHYFSTVTRFEDAPHFAEGFAPLLSCAFLKSHTRSQS